MKTRQILFSLLLVCTLAAVILTAGCISGQKTYTVGLSPAYAPLSSQNSTSGEFTGLDIDILTWIAKDQNIRFTFVPNFIGTYDEAMLAGDIDMMAAMTVTEERKTIVDFSNPYYSAPFQIVAKKDANITIDDVISGNASLSCQMESAQEAAVIQLIGQEEFDRRVANGTILRRFSAQAAVMDTASSATDTAILSTTVVRQMLMPHPTLQTLGSVGEIKDTAYGVKKGTGELLEKINAGLIHLMDSPDWAAMIEKYDLPLPKSTYVIGVDPELYPFSFHDETGKLVGYDIDSIKWIAENQGFNVEFKEFAIEDVVSALNSGEIDAWYCCLPVSEGLMNKITYTSPYYHSLNVIAAASGSSISRQDFLAGNLTIGVRSSSACSERITQMFFDTYNQMVISGKIRYYTGFDEMKADLASGKLDVIAVPRVIISTELANGVYSVVEQMDQGHVAAAVKNGDVYLLQYLNEGIEEMNNTPVCGELIAKYHMWEGHPVIQ